MGKMDGRDSRQKIIYEEYRFSVRELLRYGGAGAGIGILMAWLTYNSLKAFPLVPACMIIFLVFTRKRLIRERRRTLQYHFREFLSSLHTTLAAGYSMENAVRSAAGDVEKLYGKEDILTAELKNILWQMRCQVPVEQTFRELGERSGVEDIISFGEVLSIAKRTGGSMDRVLESTWRNLSEKIDTAQEIDTMIAAKRYEQQIMSLMPAGIILYLKTGFPGFLDTMYSTLTGRAIMTACLALYLAAFFLGRKITSDPEV